MYSDDETETSTESSGISSIDSDETSSQDEESKEAVDEEIMIIRKIRVKLDEMFESGRLLPKLLHLSADDDNDNEIIDKHIENAINIFKGYDKLENYNADLLVIAASYDMLYKGVVDEKNVTQFLNYKEIMGSHDPIDVIRYIRLYLNR